MKYRILILFFALFLITSCDAYSILTYKVSNNTNEEISIIDTKNFRPCGLMIGNKQMSDTIIIPAYSESVLLQCKHIGPKGYAKNLVKNQIPLDSILIIYSNGNQKLTTKSDLESWKRKGTTATLIIN